MIRSCKVCGEIFNPSSRYQRVCLSCRKPRGYLGSSMKVGDSVVCPECGKVFVIGEYAKKYCSRECYDSHRRRKDGSRTS